MCSLAGDYSRAVPILSNGVFKKRLNRAKKPVKRLNHADDWENLTNNRAIELSNSVFRTTQLRHIISIFEVIHTICTCVDNFARASVIYTCNMLKVRVGLKKSAGAREIVEHAVSRAFTGGIALTS